MAANENSSANRHNDVFTQNDAENKKVLIDDVDSRVYTIKEYIPKRITKKILKPSYIVLSVVILVLIIIIGVLSHNKNDSVARANLSNFSTSLFNNADTFESAHVTQDNVEEEKSYSTTYEETTSTSVEDTSHYNIIDTTRNENLLSTYDPNDNENDTSHEIILCEENSIWYFELNSQKLSLLYKSEHAINIFEVGPNKTLFLSEKNKIVSLNYQENTTAMNVNLIFEESRVNPKAMAMDFINKNLYIVDESMGGLIVINTLTKYYSLLVMDLKKPQSIAVDPSKGILFIGTSESILKGQMDGTFLQLIWNNINIGSITLDRIKEKLYWVQDFEYIISSDYSGSNQKHILADHATISELMMLGNRLFWLRTEDAMSTTLWSCSINDDNCDDHSAHYAQNTESLKNPRFARGVDQLFNSLEIQRSSERRKCNHLSLAMPGGQISCACNMGSQLVYNKTCQSYAEFGLYTLNNDTIRARILDTSRTVSLDYIWPTPFRVETLECKSSIDFDYDLKNDNFYFSDDTKIYRMKIKEKNSNQTDVIFDKSPDKSHCIQYLVYDWYTENIYYISRLKGNSFHYNVEVFNVRSNIVKTDLFPSVDCQSYYYRNHYRNRDYYTTCIYGLSISPSSGYLFFTSVKDNTYRIHRFEYTKINGNVLNKTIEVLNTDIQYDYDLRFTADFIKNRLYYISPRQNVIYHFNFDGNDLRNINTNSLLDQVKCIAVHKQWIYIVEPKRIWKLHTKRSEVVKMIEIESYIGSFKIISQLEYGKNPCRNNNGGCEQFCFISGSTSICQCRDDLELGSNGSTCESRKHNPHPNFIDYGPNDDIHDEDNEYT